MTNKEAIKMLKSKMDGHTDTSYEWCECVRLAIKALDQEPTDKSFTKADIDAIVKAINAGWELRVNEILDKIRAEIIEDCGYSKDYVGAFTYSTIKLKTVLQIIDKYKAEVEPQESEEV